jgi:hypothetical protein
MPLISKVKVPDLDSDTIIYSVYDTHEKFEHLFCTSVGLIKRNLKVDRQSGQIFVTNNCPNA